MLSLFRKLMPKEDRFFDLFERHSATLVAGAGAMNTLLQGGDGVPAACQEISRQEHAADDIAREVLLSVRRSFITPFDRTDITDLIQSMDDAIDQMNKTAKTVMLFEVRSFHPQMREMGATIVEAARLTAEAIPLLAAAAKNQQRLSELTEAIVKVEGRSDDLHDQGIKALYKECGHERAMDFVIGAEIYKNLENTVDRFEDVANEISGIVIENV